MSAASCISRFPGERVLWSGRPGAGLLFTPYDIFLVPFSIVWTALPVKMLFDVRSAGSTPAEFDYFGILFVAVGLYFVFGRFIVDMLLRRSLQYAVTDQRALIERSGLFAKHTALQLADLPFVSLRERRSGRGTIRFGEVQGWGRSNLGQFSPALDPTPQFLNIENAQTVFNLIQNEIRKLRLEHP